MEQNEQGHHDYDGIIEDREQKPPVYFTILFYGLIIWASCLQRLLPALRLELGCRIPAEDVGLRRTVPEAVGTTASEPAPAQQPEQTAAVAAAPESAPDAAAIYAQRCAMCHGEDAKGGIGPDLTVAEYANGKTPEAVTESISAGIGGGMPAFANQLKQEEIKALVDYLLSL